MNARAVRRRLRSTALLSVVGSTAVLTAAFLGLVALSSGDATGIADRVPFYVLALAVAFLGSLWYLDDRQEDGRVVLVAASGIALGAGVLCVLAAEGVAYAARDPGRVLQSEVVVYFLAAAIICTGLGFWGVRHWREFATEPMPEEQLE